MHDNVKCMLANLFRIFVIQKFVRIFFDNKKIEKKAQFLVYILFYIINTITYLKFHEPIFNLLSNIAGILSITLLYTREYRKVIFITTSVYLVDLACNAVITLEFINYISGKAFDENYEVLTVFLLFICEIALEKIIRNKETTDGIYRAPVILVPVFSLLILGLLLSDSFTMREKEIIVSAGLLLISFLFFYLYNMLIGSFGDKYEKDILREKVKIYASQLDLILQAENKVKRLRHDMKHHITEMKILAMKEDTAAMKEYLGQMERFLQSSDEIVSSGNTKIDSLLNYMIQRAKASLKKVTSKVQLPEKMKDSFDINIILGNLLENAIEAAEKTEEKELNVIIQFNQGVLRIEISNSCKGNQIKGGRNFVTTKKNKGLHGIGLSSVRKIVEKYNGLMNVNQEGNCFVVRLILYISETGTEL